MKKKYSVLLALALVAAMMLAGCSSSEDKKDDAAKDKEGTVQTTPDQDTAGKEDAEAPAEDEKIEETTLGTVEGNVYTNTYAGFGCKLGDDWTIQSAAELQDMNEAITDMLKDTEVGKDMVANQTITDMQAMSTESAASVNVVYSTLGGSKIEVLAARMMTEDQIVDGLLAQKDMLIQSYKATGMDVQDMTKETMTFLGEEHPVLTTHAVLNGADYYLVQTFNYDLDGAFGIALTFGGMSLEDIQSTMDAFYAVD